MPDIHPTAIIDDAARIADTVTIGPYCCIGRGVELADGVKIVSHAVVAGRTRVGEGTTIYPFASIGHPPQDLKYRGEPSALVIGRNNVIREGVTMNPGTEGGGMVTRIGDGCLFMVGAHVAHDCVVGDGVILANNATLAGHVSVGEHVILGGLSAVHQFVRIGAHAMIGGMSGVENDVIPFGSVTGNRAHLAGLNIVGMKRRNFAREDIHALRNAYRLLFGNSGTFAERIGEAERSFPDSQPVQAVVAFLRAESSRSICQPENGA